MTIGHPRLLLIDSYDSFTFNLASLCRSTVPNCIIHIIKNDDFTIEQLLPYLCYFSAIIVGPGPGSPINLPDIGVVRDLWKLSEEDIIPIFGVCLGLQSMGVEFGARLQRLRVVKHGQISSVQHYGTDIFHGLGPVGAVRYHSLHITLLEDGELEELAWVIDGEDNGRVVMGARHKTRPFWGVQYHPESVCTQGGGTDVLENFWKLAQEWTRDRGRKPRAWDVSVKRMFGHSWPHISPAPILPAPSPQQGNVYTAIVDLPELTVTTVAELFGASDDDAPFVLLDSAANPGRFSIVASLLPTSLQIIYNIRDTFVTLKRGMLVVTEDLGSLDIWSWLACFMRAHQKKGCPDIPFWGGLIGSLSYELGVHSLHVHPKANTHQRNSHPDVNLVFVERSVVLDSIAGKVYIQSLIPGDDQWITDTTTHLTEASSKPPSPIPTKATPPPVVIIPDRHRYITRIHQAKERLSAGDSYELCLTAPTHINIPKSAHECPTPWERYKRLRQTNPAPHSAFLRLHPSVILSSSPERFLSYSRPPSPVCQLRPIKGTVRKKSGITRAIAEELLTGSTKEVAENLMIVDLIRHDVHGVVGEDVQVKQFCSVEEYETVWQLVSVIEGRAGIDVDSDRNIGWEVLKQSLPPGSMTGAPKKRSVEILQTLEEGERSLYSGVFGYWCVGGSGDWSVTIRSCFKYQPLCCGESGNSASPWAEEWTIGAGGAITALSDPEAEWDEMCVKLQSVLKTFEG